jgi:hypothetical protein
LLTPHDEVAEVDCLQMEITRERGKERDAGEREVDVAGWELFRTADFYLLFLYFGLLAGCGLMCE